MNQSFENMTIKQLRKLTEQFLKNDINNVRGVESSQPSLSNPTAEQLIGELKNEKI